MRKLVLVCTFAVLILVGCSEKATTSKTKPTPNHVKKAVTEPVLNVPAGTQKIDKKFINDVIDETETLIKAIAFEPPVKQWADETLVDIKKYRSELRNPKFITDGIRLDCIMMIHDTLGTMANPNPMALQSQKNVVAVLEHTKPEMIGMEGHDVDDATFESLAEAQVRMAKRGNNSLTIEQARKILEQLTEQDGVLVYMKKYPNAKVTGTDPASMIVLSGYIGSPEIITIPAKNPNEKLTQFLFANLTLLRSYVAVIRTLKAAEMKKLKHSSIVIGGSHGPEILEYGKQLGIEMNFYQAVPEEYINTKEPHLKFP